MAQWTVDQDSTLRRLYAAFAGDVISIDEIAKVVDHTPGAVRYRAHKLGLTDLHRPRVARGRVAVEVFRNCAHCGTPFQLRRPSDKTQCCSRSCAAKKNRGGRSRFSTGKAKSGRAADLGDTFFRSSWERNYARYLNWLKARGKVRCWEYEPETFRFPIKRGTKSYTPDFKVHLSDGSHIWVEVKGFMDDTSRIKLNRFRLHFPEEHHLLTLVDRTRYQQLVKDFAHRLPGWE